MKIRIFIGGLSGGGAERVCCNIANFLADKNHEVEIITMADEPGVKGSLKVIKYLQKYKYKGIVEYILLPKGIDINDLGHDNFLNFVDTHKVLIDLDNPMSIKLPKLLFESKV